MGLETIEGQTTLVARSEQGLPPRLDELLAQMEPFGWRTRTDITPAGARTACTVLREHRWTTIREGRWFARFGLRLNAGFAQPDAAVQDAPTVRVIPAGVLDVRIDMCADCGSVCVRDVSSETYAGGRAVRLFNKQTGATRVAPAVMRRNVVIGWYSGKRVAGREYK